MIVGGSKCAMASEDCQGRLEFHHALKQQRLKREFKYGARRAFSNGPWWAASRNFPVTAKERDERPYNCLLLDDILGDTRNRVWLCSHHHELVTNGRLKVELPESVWEFADEFGLRGQLENDLRRAA